MQKIPAGKRFLRSSKILLQNLILFPFRIKKFKAFLNHVYEFDPVPIPENIYIKEIDIEDLFPGIYKNEIKLKNIESKYGSMELDEIYSIALLARQLDPKYIFEFGTFIGVTTLQMALNTDTAAEIYTLNLSSTEVKTVFEIGNSEEERSLPVQQPGNRFEDKEISGKIKQLYGDSAAYDYSAYHNKMDFILVDASHEYDYVKSDTENSFRMIRQGGTLIWHDYPNAPGVYKYLNELAADMKIYHLKNTHIALSLNYRNPL
jgi:predicted O-methyltransferase YrrM